jgi:hypothetical protein
MLRNILLTLILLVFLAPTSFVCAQNNSDPYVPTRYGGALLIGEAYDPNSIGLVLLQGQMIIDYDRVFWHTAPEALRLKLEVNGGLTMDGRHRGLFSLNMMALYYLDNFRIGRWLPYIEGGIGAIYTDFQVEGQGSRINFNPQLGAGLEYPLRSGRAMTVGFRLHHISNGDLLKENRGVNSAFLVIGYLF